MRKLKYWIILLAKQGPHFVGSYNKIQELYKTKEDVNSMFLTAIRKEKESIRLEGKLEGERLGTVKGAIEMGLELKFGEDSLMLIKQIKHINDLSKLEKIKDAVKKESSLEKIAGLINTL